MVVLRKARKGLIYGGLVCTFLLVMLMVGAFLQKESVDSDVMLSHWKTADSLGHDHNLIVSSDELEADGEQGPMVEGSKAEMRMQIYEEDKRWLESVRSSSSFVMCSGDQSKVELDLPEDTADRSVVWIVSHRRGGMSFLADFLQQQFGDALQILEIKDHSPADEFLACDKLAWYRSKGIIFYVYRDPVDTLVGLREYNRKFREHTPNLPDYIRERNSFSLDPCVFLGRIGDFEFECLRDEVPREHPIRSLDRVQYLKYHRRSWLRYPHVHAIALESLKADPETSLQKIEGILSLTRKYPRRKADIPVPRKARLFHGNLRQKVPMDGRTTEWVLKRWKESFPDSLLKVSCCADA